MNKLQRIITLLFTGSALAACAAPDTYVSPSEGPRSKVRFVSAQWVGYADFGKYNDPSCSAFKASRMFRLLPAGSQKATSPHKSLGIPFNTYDEGQYREVYLPSDKPTVMYVNGMGDTVIFGVCQVHFYYPLEEGHEYEFKYTPKPPQDCEVSLSEIVYDKNGPKLLELKTYPSDMFGSLKHQEGCTE